MRRRGQVNGSQRIPRIALPVALTIVGLGCHSDTGPCFGLEKSRSYVVSVVERFDQSSRFSPVSGYVAGGNTCGPLLAMMPQQNVDVTVLSQSGGTCRNSFVSVGAVPNVEYVRPFSYDGSEETSSDDIFSGTTTAKVGECVGTFGWHVTAITEPANHGNPFAKSTPGQQPAVLLSVIFMAPRTAACGTAVPSIIDPAFGDICADYYVVEVSPKGA